MSRRLAISRPSAYKQALYLAFRGGGGARGGGEDLVGSCWEERPRFPPPPQTLQVEGLLVSRGLAYKQMLPRNLFLFSLRFKV